MPENEKELFSDKRWNQPLGGKVIGHREITEEEKKELEEYLERLKKNK